MQTAGYRSERILTIHEHRNQDIRKQSQRLIHVFHHVELTSIDICGHIDRAANNCQEPCVGSALVRAELDGHVGAGAGEGAGDGGAAVALAGVPIIDLNPVKTNILVLKIMMRTVHYNNIIFTDKKDPHLNINSFK